MGRQAGGGWGGRMGRQDGGGSRLGEDGEGDGERDQVWEERVHCTQSNSYNMVPK